MAKTKSFIKILQIVSLLAGLALFVYLVYSVGFQQILDSIKTVGIAGFVLLILVSACRHFLRSFAWLQCFEEDHRRIGVFNLFNIRMAGDAVRFLSFTGPVLGETSKAVLLRKRLPMIHGVSSIIIENLSYTFTAILVIISGLLLFILNFTTQRSVKWMSFALCLSLITAILVVWLPITRNKKIFTDVIGWLAKKTGIEWFTKQKNNVSETEQKVHDFYKRRGRLFLWVLLLQLGVHLINIFEVYLILYFLHVKLNFLTAYIVEAVAKVVNVLFFFVPGQIGVTEGSNVFLFRVLGLGISAGIALSLIEKIRVFFWIGYGLLVWIGVFRESVKSSAEKKSTTVNELSPKETS